MITKSPLNYTGNKSRILEQITKYFPTKINRFVDLCCGGASIGLNAHANNIICIDTNQKVIELLRALKFYPENKIIEKVDKISAEFNLSDSFNKGYDFYKNFVEGNNGLKAYNKDGYLRLREFYNKNLTDVDYLTKSIYLYSLLVYCFNNDIRFNSSGGFNMPIGKTDFNGSMRKKLSSFKETTNKKNIDFIHADFNIVKDLELTQNDFLYVDPPYLITTAVYNENGGWDKVREQELLNVLDFLNAREVKFALSNVLRKNGAENSLLVDWVKRNNFNVIEIDYHYRSSSYNKKDREAKEQEVLVINYEISTS